MCCKLESQIWLLARYGKLSLKSVDDKRPYAFVAAIKQLDVAEADRVVLSDIHEYHEAEELVERLAVAIVNLPFSKMMGIDSEGMLIPAVHEYDGKEALNLFMADGNIHAGLSCTDFGSIVSPFLREIRYLCCQRAVPLGTALVQI